MTTTAAPPRPGWYPDPLGRPGERWYDGEGWTGCMRRSDLSWRAAGGLAATLVGLLVLSAGLQACLAYAFSQRPGAVSSPAAFDDNERAITLLGFADLGLSVAVVVLWLVWFAVAYGNAGTLRDVRLPRLAVWAWFLPVANLVLPKLMVNDLWAAGDESRDGGRRSRSWLVDAWWVTFLAAMALLVRGDQLTLTDSLDRDVRLAKLADGAGVLRYGFAVGSLAAILAALVVARATHRLHRRRPRAEGR